MSRAFLPKALALTVLTAGMTLAFAQQAPPAAAPDAGAPQAPDAQPMYRHHHAPNPQRQAAMLSRKLNLTPDQTARLEPILVARNQQVQAVKANQQLSPEDRHQQMHAINKQTRQQMSAVLSPDQMAQLKALRHAHMHHGANGQVPQEDGQSPS